MLGPEAARGPAPSVPSENGRIGTRCATYPATLPRTPFRSISEPSTIRGIMLRAGSLRSICGKWGSESSANSLATTLRLVPCPSFANTNARSKSGDEICHVPQNPDGRESGWLTKVTLGGCQPRHACRTLEVCRKWVYSASRLRNRGPKRHSRFCRILARSRRRRGQRVSVHQTSRFH
jgi:hypothetical protein